MHEKIIQAKIIKWLKTIPDNYVRKISDRYRSGIPDIIGCYNGRFYSIEVKQPTGKLSKIQIYEMGKIFKAEGLYLCAKDLDDVKGFWNVQIEGKKTKVKVRG